MDYTSLPSDLPRPEDDGAADHLPGARMPGIVLQSTDGGMVGLDTLGDQRTVLYIYPLTGSPLADLPDGWNDIPGARGCTPEACSFRDHHTEIRQAGAAAVFGLSAQSTEYQVELAQRLELPYNILSDPGLKLADTLGLPTFSAGGQRLYSRLTLIICQGRVERVFYPVFPPNEHAEEVLRWLRDHPVPVPS